MSSKQLKRIISMQKRGQHGLTIKGCELVEFPLEVQRDLKNVGTCLCRHLCCF